MRIATAMSVTLFPKVFLMERIRRSDTIILLSDDVVDSRKSPHRCRVRTTLGGKDYIGMQLLAENRPADDCRVAPPRRWQRTAMEDAKRAYASLLHTQQAQDILHESFEGPRSDWLTDYLMHSLEVVLQKLGWTGKEILRGDSRQRRRYKSNDEYLLNLCLEAEADALIVGRTQWTGMNMRLFANNGVKFMPQDFEPKGMLGVDSILDVIARNKCDTIDSLF